MDSSHSTGTTAVTTFHSFGAFGSLPKGRIFMLDVLGFAPNGFITWIMERDKSPGIVKLRENRAHAHEVAAKLIENKKQELKNGTPRKDLLSLLGQSAPLRIPQSSSRNITYMPSVKANSAVRPDWRLHDDEIVAQVRYDRSRSRLFKLSPLTLGAERSCFLVTKLRQGRSVLPNVHNSRYI
jgi:hypothetical protein